MSRAKTIGTTTFNNIKSAAEAKLRSPQFVSFSITLISETLVEDTAERIAEVVTSEDASWRETGDTGLTAAEKKMIERAAEIHKPHDGRPGGLAYIILSEEKCAQWKKAVADVAQASIRAVQEMEEKRG